MITLRQEDGVVYLCGAVCGEGGSEIEVRRVQAEVYTWRAVEGVMADRRISRRLKAKVLSVGITSTPGTLACMGLRH